MAPTMALEKPQNAGVFRGSKTLGDRRYGGRAGRAQPSAAVNLTMANRKRHARAFGMRLVGFIGVVLVLPLGLVSLLPQSGANSQPLAPLAYNVFATRWPAENAFLRSVSAFVPIV